MKQLDIENPLLEQVIGAFQTETGLLLDVVKEHVVVEGQQVDAIVRLPDQGHELAVEIKRWAQQANIGVLAGQVKRLPMKAILAADYVNPNMAQKLKAMEVQFIDAQGNAYINQSPIYVYVTGNKRTTSKANGREELNRAFDAAGLKVIFGLLCDPRLVNETYREIAKQTGIALGAVGKVLKGLVDAGFLTEKGRAKERRLVNKIRLFDRWVEAYPEKLKPKLIVGEFYAEDPNWWKHIDIEECGAYWGGEIAAAKYTAHLKPQNATVYLPEAAGKALLAKARLRKQTTYNEAGRILEGGATVRIFRPFWSENFEQTHSEPKEFGKGLVHPILVYADLVATGDSRNVEIARMIYERAIAEHIGED